MSVDAFVIAADEELYERRARVLTMRNAGATFTQISDRINAARIEAGLDPLSATTFRKDHQLALRDVAAASREDLIAEARSVLLDLRRSHYGAALNGDIDSSRIVLATVEQERRMFGLDAPTQVALGISDVDFVEKMYDAITGLGLEPPKEIADGVRHAREDAEYLSPANMSATTISAEKPVKEPKSSRQTNGGAQQTNADARRPSDDDVIDVDVVDDVPADVDEKGPPPAPSRRWSNLD